MKTLPLYTDIKSAVERSEVLTSIDTNCTRCVLHKDARSVCMPADAVRLPDSYTSGALLVLDSSPLVSEDHARRPVSAASNGAVRAIVEELWDGPIVYADAIRCPTKSSNVSESIVQACRPYTAGLIHEVKPSRVLCFGKQAFRIVIGSSCDPMQIGRRGYGYLSDKTPVFSFPRASRIVNNRFLMRRLKADIVWALETDPPLPPWDGKIFSIETVEDSIAACGALRKAGGFTFDTETAGLMGDDYFQVVCLTATAYGDEDNAWLWGEEQLKDAAILKPLRELLAEETCKKTGHNLKFDIEATAHGLGLRDRTGVIEVAGADFDTMLVVKSLDTECKGALDHADHKVGMGGHKYENENALKGAVQLVKKARTNPKQKRFAGLSHKALAAAVAHPDANEKAFAYGLVPRDILYRYCALDTVATARLRKTFLPIVRKKPSLTCVTNELFIPATKAVAQIEAWGMSASVKSAQLFGRALRPVLDSTVRQLQALGCDINIRSNLQLSKYLFNDLGLPVQAVSEQTGAPKVDKWTLEKLAGKHPSIPLILEHSKISKLISTYVDGLIPHIRDDGRIRTSLNLGGARSGRLSSSSPNLQNIPSRGSWAKMAKSIFNAPEGHVLIQLDYSQLEVRVAAILSQDPDLRQAYLDGVDVHRRTASRAFGVAEKDVTKEYRTQAKTVVFGVMYGKTPVSLANDLSCSIEKAQDIYDSVLGVYSTLHEWMKKQIRVTEKTGVTWTYLPRADGTLQKARCRQLWQVADISSKAQSRARNGAVNTPIQGTASDFMLRTLSAVVQWIVDDGIPARVTNTVHDSILLEVPVEWAIEVAENVKAIMESWPSLGVPIVADIEFGHTWGSMISYESLKFVASCVRNGLSEADIIALASGTDAVSDDLGSDPVRWYQGTKEMVRLLGLVA